MANFVKHEGCPKCNSSDALAIYDDGGAHCFSSGCDYHINGSSNMDNTQIASVTDGGRLRMGGTVAAIPQRRLSQETCNRYGITVEFNATGEIHKHY